MKPRNPQLAKVLAAMLLVAALAGCGGGNHNNTGGMMGSAGGMMHSGPNSVPAGSPTSTAPTARNSAAAGNGQALFLADCGGCHTLAAAGTTGTAGPDLDQTHPNYDRVLAQVTNGGGGMPAFAGSLTRAQIEAIARYVGRTTK